MAGVEGCRGGLAGFGGVGLAWQDSEGDGRRRKTGVWGASAGVARIPKGSTDVKGRRQVLGVIGRRQHVSRGGHRQRLPGFRRGQQVSRGIGRFQGSSAGVGMSRGGNQHA